MERRHLRYMIALADEGGFTRAAECVGIAQPPFSKQIKDLEIEIGTQLVRRTPRGATLTPAGKMLVERAREIEARFEDAIVTTQRVGAGQMGRLRVGFTESGIFHPRLVAAFLAFRSRYPEIELLLEEALSSDLIAGLEAGRLDAAFIRPPLPDGLDWVSRPVASEGMVAALPAGHPLAARESMTLGDLRAETFVLYHRRVRPGMTDAILSACERAGFDPATVQVVPKITSALRLVAAGAGITIVPASLAGMAMDGVTFVALPEAELRAEITYLWRRANASSPVSNLWMLASAEARDGQP